MVRNPKATETKAPDAAAPENRMPRDKIVSALMQLAAEYAFERISITQICETAGVSLADFRECFPSKGAILASYSRMIDLKVLRQSAADLADEPAKDRLFDILMRRLDAMEPEKLALEGVVKWARREPLASAALNQMAMNSMRFMLEAAGIEADGPGGLLKLQGLVLGWTRILNVWFHDDSADLGATMAAMDKMLARGEKLVGRAEDVEQLLAPFGVMARAIMNAGQDFGARMRERGPGRDAGRTVDEGEGV
ncbi:MAG: TetR/AcrR family transcriptional regulator [Hyphomicrobiales bacterium]|nr:TetR/AcrR family transcriptional regulator [Hyphomicrobiales bacterium]